MKNTTKTRSPRRPSAALVIACLALFMAMAGSAFAAQSMIRSQNIVNGTIRTVDLHDNAVKSAKIADATVTADDLATDSVATDEIAPDAVTSSEIAPNAVTSSEIAPDAVGASQIASSAVGAGELDQVIQRSNTTSIAANSTATISVSCTGGEQLLSGGGQPANFGVEMTTSRPSGNTWTYQAKNQNATASTVTAYALCLAG